jgi:hypothetical protein
MRDTPGSKPNHDQPDPPVDFEQIAAQVRRSPTWPGCEYGRRWNRWNSIRFLPAINSQSSAWSWIHYCLNFFSSEGRPVYYIDFIDLRLPSTCHYFKGSITALKILLWAWMLILVPRTSVDTNLPRAVVYWENDADRASLAGLSCSSSHFSRWS